MMDELEQLVDSASAVPVRGKQPPKTVQNPKSKKSDKIKETALAIIEDTLQNKRDATDKIMKKVDKSLMPVKAVFEAFQNFEQALGGRHELINILQHCPETSTGYSMIQRLLADPDFLEYARTAGDMDNVKYSLSTICGRHRIPFNAVVTAFKDAKTAEIAVQSLQAMAPAAPKLVEQVVLDAQNTFQECYVCEGSGRIWRITEHGEWAMTPENEHITQICHNCRGKGKVFKEHDAQDRKHALQILGILKDTKVPLVQQNFNQQATVFRGDFVPGDGSFEALIKAVDEVSKPTEGKELIDIPFTVYEAPEAKEEASDVQS